MSVIPILLGDGIPHFRKGYAEADLQLIDCKPYETGAVGLTYAVNADAPTPTPRKKRAKGSSHGTR